MAKNNQDIIEKIRKLLALSNSENEHESRLAAERAQRLMVKYNLAMQEVNYADTDIIEDAIIKSDYLFHPRLTFVLNIIALYFHVKPVERKTYAGKLDGQGRRRFNKTIVFIGRDVNVVIAKDVFQFLDGAFKRLFAEYCRETGATTGSQKSFFQGLTLGLETQLKKAKQEEETGAGLVLVEDADLQSFLETMNLVKGKNLAGSRHDASAYNRGKEEGEKLKIRRSLNEGATTQGLSLGARRG